MVRPSGRGAGLAALLVLAVAGLGCGTSQPRFGSLEANARKLNVENQIRLFELSNGMLVALAPDERTNLVSVDMRYQVGAAQDPVGRTGLAHLVEHLTFEVKSGSQGATILDRLQSLGLYVNAYTNHDVTHYTSTALADRVDALLELEAQRLEARCDQLDDKLVARERDVVLAEEAERHSEVTAAMGEIAAAVWGPDHPYARPLTNREIAKATKADVCGFFDAYYVPKRAVLVVTGNIDPVTLQQRIGRRFGPIAREATGRSASVPMPALAGTQSKHQADIDHAVAQIFLPAPAWGDGGEATHDLTVASLRGALWQLDREVDWMVGASVGYAGAGQQRVTVITVEVTDPDRLGAAVDAVLARGRDLFQDDDHDGNAGDNDDPDDREVTRQIGSLRGRLQTAAVMQADAIEGRGAWLADFLTYTTHNTFMLEHMRAVDAVTAQALVDYAGRLFDRRHAHVALIWPSGDAKAAAATFAPAGQRTYDLVPWRVEVDAAEAAKPLSLPRGAVPVAIDDYRFDNGLRVLMFLDPTSPIIDARLVYPVGTIDEVPMRRGVARFAAGLLDHDYDREYVASSIDKINWAFGIGTQLGTAVGDAATVFSSGGLGIFGDWHLWRLSWLLDQGTYPGKDLELARRKLRQVGDDELSPSGMVFRERLFGRGHPYAARPATVAQLSTIGRSELAAWRRDHFATTGATLIVTGGFDREAMRRTVNELFGSWSRSTPVARNPVRAPQPAPGPSWLGVRIPNAIQVALYVSFAAGSNLRDDRAARMVLTEMVADRLRIVREGLGASYGVRVSYSGGTAGSALDVVTGLDPGRAPEAAQAVMAELVALQAGAGSRAEDFARARRRVLARLLASSRDATSVADELQVMVANDLGIEELHGLAAAVANLTPAAVAAVAAADLAPGRMVVSVDGRVEPVQATLTALGATDPTWFDE